MSSKQLPLRLCLLDNMSHPIQSWILYFITLLKSFGICCISQRWLATTCQSGGEIFPRGANKPNAPTQGFDYLPMWSCSRRSVYIGIPNHCSHNQAGIFTQSKTEHPNRDKIFQVFVCQPKEKGVIVKAHIALHRHKTSCTKKKYYKVASCFKLEVSLTDMCEIWRKLLRAGFLNLSKREGMI